MPNIEAQPEWANVREIGIELARGGPDGNMNEQAKALVARTELLKEEKANKTDIVQGQYRFTTLAKFNAVKSTIPINSTVIIDEAGENQGANTWDGTTLKKSAYDPVVQSKNYTDNKINNLGITNSSSNSISVAIVDEDDNRTWLEADGAGKPTSYAAQNIIEIAEPSIEQKIQTEKPIIVQEAVLQATQETLEQVGIEQRSFESISVAIVDPDDTRTWLEADETGKPTDYSKSLLVEALDNDIAQKLADSGIGQSSSVGMSVAIVDEDDNRTWLEADEAGKPTPYAAQQIAEAIQFNDVVIPSEVKSTYQTQSIKAVSGPDIVCYGDSMTAGAGSAIPYTKVLQDLLAAQGSNANVYNAGVGGESSPGITARQGGTPFIVRVVDGLIPADRTGVKVTFDTLYGTTIRPLMQGHGSPGYGFVGDLNGIKGTISLVRPNGSSSSWDDANYYLFTRNVAGSEVVANRPSPFYLDFAKAHLGDIHIIWIGQNGPSTDRAISDAKAMIEHMNTLSKRYLVISKPTASTTDDAAFFAAFGERFVPIKRYLIEFGLQDANINPTDQDLADIAVNNIPSSLRSDAVHWNAAGYAILGQQIFKKLNQLGWI